jgi:hypothetical protein
MGHASVEFAPCAPLPTFLAAAARIFIDLHQDGGLRPAILIRVNDDGHAPPTL